MSKGQDSCCICGCPFGGSHQWWLPTYSSLPMIADRLLSPVLLPNGIIPPKMIVHWQYTMITAICSIPPMIAAQLYLTVFGCPLSVSHQRWLSRCSFPLMIGCRSLYSARDDCHLRYPTTDACPIVPNGFWLFTFSIPPKMAVHLQVPINDRLPLAVFYQRGLLLAVSHHWWLPNCIQIFLAVHLRKCDCGPSKFDFCNFASLRSLLPVPLLSSPFSSGQDGFKN